MLKLKEDLNDSSVKMNDYAYTDEQSKDFGMFEKEMTDDMQMINEGLPNDSVAEVRATEQVVANDAGEEKKDNPILSALFLIGFFAYLGLFYITAQVEPKLAISVFGALWLFISIVCVVNYIKDGIKDLKKVLFTFILMYLGVGLTFVPLLQLYVPAFGGGFGFRMAMYLVFIFCIIVGALLDGMEAYQMIHNKIVCTVPIQALCLKLQDKYFWRDEVSVEEAKGYTRVSVRPGRVGLSYRTKAVRGVFEFEYRGEKYEVEDDINSGFDHPTPDEKYTLYINPDNPKEFYRRMPITHLGMFLIGTSFLVMGIWMCMIF